MSESNRELPLAALAASKAGAKVFRNNTGMAWQGDSVRLNDGSLLIRQPRPLHAGLTKGSSDLIGWKPITITEDMVGKTLAVFTAIEVKTRSGVVTKDQKHFIDLVNKDGGIAGVARTPNDVTLLLAKKLF